MASPSTYRKAKKLVQSIANGHGYLGEHVYAKMDPEMRRNVQEAILAKDKIIGGSVILLAREIYSKDVRFIFELLQNADDNHYKKALGQGDEPRVTFKLYKEKVVIECNEDGFNEANLRAICSIRKSSKVGGHGYIGEKGIGFKSVFKVAWKVHIQSGDYSFTFTHRRGDPGIGMISPEWEDSSSATVGPDPSLTRITLYLHQDSEAATLHENILQQLNDLENTMLLFLKKLRRVNVYIHDNDGVELSYTALSIKFNEATQRAVLTKSRSSKGASTETATTYCHVSKHMATGLAKSRTYTAEEEAARTYDNAEVILAFPLTSDDVPIVEAQQVFAFLPIRRLGFKFLIQTDFVTMANREDVVSSAPRNLALLEGIAEAFVKSVHQMYGHKTLRYQWMRYLDGMNSYPWDDFWKRLVEKITAKIQQAEIIEPRRRGAPRLIKDLRHIPSLFSGASGEPIFRDLPGKSEIYISTGYMRSDVRLLEEYGLKAQHMGEFIDRARHDLSLDDSLMKSPSTVQDWHTRAAGALSYPWRQSSAAWSYAITLTKALQILPLEDGRWITATGSWVYFPTLDNGITVPTSLGLEVLAASACANSQRRKFFEHLGARHATVEEVRAKILAKYAREEAMTLQASHDYLVFLYQTCTHQPNAFEQYRNVKLYDAESEAYSPIGVDMFLPSEDPFSPWQLSLQNKSSSARDPLLRFLSYVNPIYLENAPPDSGALSWRDWLHSLGVRKSPRLVRRDGTILSDLCVYIAKERPNCFLGFLKHSWEYEKASVLKNNNVLRQLKWTTVLCHGLDLALQDTYLPLPSLQEIASDLMGGVAFPFLWLGGSTLSEEDVVSWNFLKRDLQVGYQDDAQFYTNMLMYIACADSLTDWLKHKEKIVEIYRRIHSRLSESKDRRLLESRVYDDIREGELILIPGMNGEVRWASCNDCVLNAPSNLRHKWPILELYKAAFPSADLAFLPLFLGNTLEVDSYFWSDAINEIQYLKNEDCCDFDLVKSYYESVDKTRKKWVFKGPYTKMTRQLFEEGSLILVRNGSNQCKWVKPSECLWSSATKIQGRTSLNAYFDERLEDFFVDVLGVSRLHVDMVYDELLRMQPNHATTKQAEELIWQMNSLLTEGEEPSGTPEKLLKAPIWPVQHANGDVKLCSAENEFVIVDNRPLEELFRGKVKFLNFDHGQVHKLEAFLRWAGLEKRYLSRLAQDIALVDEVSATPITDRSRQILKKAEALTRMAVHLRSPRAHNAQSFYNLLRNSKTLETRSITSEVTVYQDGTKVSVKKAQSDVLIREDAERLAIFVPDSEASLDVCFGSSLPKQLVTWMMTDPVTRIVESTIDKSAIGVLVGILAARSAAGANRILDENGIVDVDIPDLSTEIVDHTEGVRQPSTPQNKFSNRRLFALPRRPRRPIPRSSASPFSALGTPTSSAITTLDVGSGRPPIDVALRPSPAIYVFSETTTGETNISEALAPGKLSGGRYRNLLAHIVAAARGTVQLPRYGTASSVTDINLLASNPGPMFAPAGLWAARDNEKALIGAAGELFAFELLRTALRETGEDKLDLPREVWQTPLRAHVAESHEEYAEMKAWPRAERADFIIDNRAATALVGLLAQGGYLSAEEGGPSPTCYVDVNATMGPCKTPFFISDSQHSKMKELTTENSIYMIFHVFNMGNKSIGMRIYMDPARMSTKPTQINSGQMETDPRP